MTRARKASTWLLGLALAGAAYLCFWPTAVEPVSWQASPPPGYVGPHASNYKLAGLKQISIGQEVGPEHIAIGPDGLLYAAVASGKILRMKPDGSELSTFINTGGRVLGFDFDAQGRLIAADAMKGLLAVSPDGKAMKLLTQEVSPGDPILYADGVVVAPDGQIYFTDASRRFAPVVLGSTFEASVLDILEQASTGRVLVFNPATGQTRILAKGLAFANGIALSADGQSLFVNETGKYRVWKFSTAAQGVDILQLTEGGKLTPHQHVQLMFDNLPGYPDNLMRGQEGRIWLGFAKPRNPVIDKLADKPWLRKLVLRLPRAWWPVPKAYGHVMAFTEDGKVVADLQDPTGAYPETTSVTETIDRRYVQSLHAPMIGWMPR